MNRLLAALLLVTGVYDSASLNLFAQRRVLVYTRNHTADGKGYVHENIADSVAAIQRMGNAEHFEVDVSSDPAVFTDETLQRYGALIFSNSNDEAFNSDAQRGAFQRYIHAGHGFVGIHSAAGSERNWPYLQQVLGGRFAFHPHEQSFIVRVSDPNFPVTRPLPSEFVWTDECYFIDRLNPDIHPVLVTDSSNLLLLGIHSTDLAHFPNPLPLAWYHTFDNGREFYLALGHNASDYHDPMLYGIIDRAIRWVLRDTN